MNGAWRKGLSGAIVEGPVDSSEDISTESTGAGEIARPPSTPELSTETLRLALLDSVQ